MDKTKRKTYRPDHEGVHERLYRKNRNKLIKAGGTCAICGAPIDARLKFPHPLSPSVDHIQAIAKGGHPSDMENLQLTHLICNQLKGTKQTIENNRGIQEEAKLISNKILPQTIDWTGYRG